MINFNISYCKLKILIIFRILTLYGNWKEYKLFKLIIKIICNALSKAVNSYGDYIQNP